MRASGFVSGLAAVAGSAPSRYREVPAVNSKADVTLRIAPLLVNIAKDHTI